MRSSQRHHRAFAFAPVLALIAGLLLGLAAGIVPRLYGLDPLQLVTQAPAAPEPVAEPEQNSRSLKKELVLRDMINDVKKQREALLLREKPLQTREAQLQQERKSLEKLKQDIDAVAAHIRASAVTIDLAETKNLKRLAKMWAQMEPQEVVRMLQGLDLELASKIMASMQEKQAAPILAALAASPGQESTAVALVKKLKQLTPAEPRPNSEAQ